MSIPEDFRVDSIADDSVELSWSPVEGCDTYQVSVKRAGGFLFFNSGRKNCFNVKEATTHTVRNLEKGAAYEFCVRCKRGVSWGKWSARIVAKTNKPHSWRECTGEEKRYVVHEKNPAIATAAGEHRKSTVAGSTPFPLGGVTKWSVRVLRSRESNGFGICVGVAPVDVQQEEDNYMTCGWYLDCYDSALWSGPPHSFRNKEYGPRKEDGEYVHTGDSVGVVVDTTKGELSFILNNADLGVAYEGIPLDKPLVPCVILKWKGDSVELGYSSLDSPKPKPELLEDNETSDDSKHNPEPPEENEAEKANLEDFYPEEYKAPTLEEALLQAGLAKEKVETICSACYEKARGVELSDEFTADDAAAVAMYTFDFGKDDHESNPREIINKSLEGKTPEGFKKAGGLIYLVVTALRKLPRVGGKTLYGGLRDRRYLKEYVEGNTITWPGVSAVSHNMDTSKKQLGVGSENGVLSGIFFIVGRAWGYDIQPYSLHPEYEEVVIEPGMQFKVTGILNTEAIIMINLEMVESPLILPSVFGAGKS